jgi:hypothetical protein
VDPVTGAIIVTGNPALDDFNSDNFSIPDVITIESHALHYPGFIGYLGTPSGAFLEWDPASTPSEQVIQVPGPGSVLW